MQIHDELIVDAAADEVDEVAALLKKEMEAVYVSEVRLDVNVSFGKIFSRQSDVKRKVIAVTGGIGSGKSTVCRLLEKRAFGWWTATR